VDDSVRPTMSPSEEFAFFTWYVVYQWQSPEQEWQIHRSDRAPCHVCVDLWRRKQEQVSG